MDIEVLVHGVPKGQGCYGIKEEQSHVDLFYDNSSESVKFVIETKELGNAYYTYYTYLRYKGMLGYGGRPGSYFGLTLRIDKYYQDVIHMYNMLEMVFKKYVVGSLLKPSGESYEYMAPSFAAKKSELEQLQRGLIQMIQNSCVFSKFVDLDASFIHPITTAASCNIADITENAMLAALKKYSKVVFSPDYKLNLAKEYEKKIQEVEGKGGGIVAEKDKKLAEKDGVINSQQVKIEALQAEVKRKETEILQNKKNLQLSQMISGIKEPINSLADYFHVQDSQKKSQKPSYGYKNFILGIAGCVLSLIIILLCIVLIAKKPNPNPELESLSKQYDELKVEKADLQTQYDNLQLDYNDLNVRYQHLLTKENAQTKTLRIDVDKYSQGQPLMTTKEYTITIKEGQSNFNGNGKWILTNVDITKGKDTDVQITITPTGKGQVTLEYESDNCTCPKRTFNIQTPTDKVDVSFSLEITPDQDSVLVGSRYTITVKGYDGEIDEWRYFGCKGDKKSKLTTEITIVNDGMSKEAIITFVPKGMKVEEARKHQIRRPIKL